MTAPSREAIEAAAATMPGGWNDALGIAERAFTAALPHLDAPPLQSDKTMADVDAATGCADDALSTPSPRGKTKGETHES